MGDDLRPEAVARGLFEASPDMYYAVNEEGRLVWWNEEVRETTGYDESILKGLEVFELLPPEQRDDARAAFEHTGLFPDEVSLTFDLVTSDGERIPHEFNGARLEVDGRTVVVGIGRDITARRKRERVLRRRQDELETLNCINETVYEVIEDHEEIAPGDLYQEYWNRVDDPKADRTIRNYLNKLEQYNFIAAE